MYGRSRPAPDASRSDPAMDWNAPAADTGLEESMWPLSIGGRDSYPERPGEPDCPYYMRTGFCGYGAKCRFNHPRDRYQVMGLARPDGGEFPERVGQPVCKYYLKTGTCKFGATCKYHHPKYGGGSVTPVSLNYYGYPLRPGEKECSYYVKTGQCKFGVTCKFHHPQPSGISMPGPAPTFYPTVQPSSVPSPQYGGVGNWQVARQPLLPGSYMQGPYGSVLLSPGVLPVSGWTTYPPPPVSPGMSPGTQNITGSPFGLTHQALPSAPAYPGPYSQSIPGMGPSSSSQKENMFPERPGEPECQFYMRTGDCKFGSTCKYHHPRDWILPKTNCVLSPMGLPLRPGAPPCIFYAQHGVCKFGPTCKFDHQIGTLSYSSSASSLADMPVVPYPVGLSMATLAPSSSSSEQQPEFSASGPLKDSSFSTRMPSTQSTPSGSVGSIFSKGGGPVSRYHGQFSGQSSVPLSGTGQGTENLPPS